MNKIKKIAIVGSRKMSSYGKEVINLLITNFKLRITNFEIVTIRVGGCNSEVLQSRIKNGGKYKVFEGNNFEKLNEEVAVYADCLVIVEAGQNSGTLLLARNFIEKNKSVYAVPGRITDPNSFGTNWLIEQGAIPLINIDDWVRMLQ